MANRFGLSRYQGFTLLSLRRNMVEFPGRTLSVMFPRQAGKNEVSAWLVSQLLLEHAGAGGSIVVCAPTLYPQATLSFERTADRIRRYAPLWKLQPKFEGNVIRCGAAHVTFLSGSPDANVAGHTASLLLIGDEAQDLNAAWFDRQFRPMTSSTGASTILFGTPWQGGSLLEEAREHNRRRDLRMRDRGKRFEDWFPWHNQVRWGIVARHRKGYGRHIEQERRRLGESHPIFQSQYLLRAASAEGRLLTPEQLWALEAPFGCRLIPAPGERYAGGLDFGGESANADATVLTIARSVDDACEVVAVFRWVGKPFHDVSGEIVRLVRTWRLERLVCDSTGLGAPLTATLRRELGNLVQPLPFTRPEKSKLGFELQAAASNRTLRVPPPLTEPLRMLWDELRICGVTREPGGQITWEAPGGGHDDCVVSLALCLRACSDLKPARVALGHSRRD